MYKTSQIANMLQVSQMTISRWVTKEFSSFFPDTAKVERGASRRFTDEEVSKLTLIATMRKEGHGLDAIEKALSEGDRGTLVNPCLLYTSPSPRDGLLSRMPSSA